MQKDSQHVPLSLSYNTCGIPWHNSLGMLFIVVLYAISMPFIYLPGKCSASVIGDYDSPHMLCIGFGSLNIVKWLH